MKTRLRQAWEKQVWPRQTPDNLSTGSGRYPGNKQSRRCPIDRARAASRDFMQGTVGEAARWQNAIDFWNPEWQHCPGSYEAAFEMLDALAQFGNQGIFGGRLHRLNSSM